MQISSRFTIAIHVLIFIATYKHERKITSDLLALSVNVNPVIIRRLLQQLKTAGIVSVVRGSGGAEIARPLCDITLLDVYNAVECVENGNLFHFHENPNHLCPVGRNIHTVLDLQLNTIQETMERKMRSVTMESVLSRAEEIIQKDIKNR